MLPLSATLSREDAKPFRLDGEDRAHDIVARRLNAHKSLTVAACDEKELPKRLASEAWDLMLKAGAHPRVLVYCNARTHAEQVKSDLDKRAKRDKVCCECESILFVGGRRVFERVAAAGRLKRHGLLPRDGAEEPAKDVPVFVVATSAGEVGVDLDADHMVSDLVAWERMVQRLGRVDRRGTGKARVRVIDRIESENVGKGSDANGDFDRKAVRALLDALPQDGGSGWLAGPGALARLADHPKWRETIERASTRPPLYPALTRALVDAWSMTSLDEHTGRPEIGPWLRGWVEDEPRTSVIWRCFLPLRWDGNGNVEAASHGDIAAFFDAAPPRLAELLETEIWRVADWLKKRAAEQKKTLGRQATRDEGAVSDAAEDAADATLAPLTTDAPVAFVLDGGNRPGKDCYSLSLRDIVDCKKDELAKLLIGKRLVVDARLGGLEDGLLNSKCRTPVMETVDAKNAENDSWGRPTFRIAVVSNEDRIGNDAQEVLALRYRVTREGEADAWLVVRKLPGVGEGEDARAVTRREQLLDQHREWTEKEAADIARRLDLPDRDQAMLRAAARHHDDGKAAKRWQRAARAPGAGLYAKTRGPFDGRALNGYRHEFGSVLDAEAKGLDDLALHLIAAHHGYARPVIGVEGHDDLPPSAAESKALEIALRFARLQRRWGPWGLAWWEALLRAADQRASRRLDRG